MPSPYNYTLAVTAAKAGYKLDHFQSVQSTIAYARNWAQDHALNDTNTVGHWIIADEQTGGVGRRGRTWSSPPGNLYASLVVPLENSPHKTNNIVYQLPIVISLALFEALKNLADADKHIPVKPRVGLKWPNDVLVNDKKIAGLLIETFQAHQQSFLIISMGINCTQTPDFEPEAHSFPASTLQHEGLGASVDEIFTQISDRVAVYLDLWHKASHFDAMRTEWLANAIGLDKPISARLHQQTIVGDFVGIDEWGQLILKQADGSKQTISNADIFYL